MQTCLLVWGEIYYEKYHIFQFSHVWCDIVAANISYHMSNQHKWKLENICGRTRSNASFNKVTSQNCHLDISLETFQFDLYLTIPVFCQIKQKRGNLQTPQENWQFLVECSLFLISIYFPSEEWLSESTLAFNLGRCESKSAALWQKCYTCLFWNWHDRWQMTEALLGQVKS